MKKILKALPTLLPLALLPYGHSLKAAPVSKLNGFDFFELGMPYSALVEKKAACDAPKDSPSFRDSLKQGVGSTVCPTHETFAMATLLNNHVASIAVNWVSWDIKKLKEAGPALSAVPEKLRQQYGIPAMTMPYEPQFGNDDADALCGSEGYSCQMHIWKGTSPYRVANLVFAKNGNVEIPLLFNLSDLKSEGEIEKIKNRGLQAAINAAIKEAKDSH